MEIEEGREFTAVGNVTNSEIKEIRASSLPKKKIYKKNLLRRKTLYDLLSKKYFLPAISSNACTAERLRRLTDLTNKYSAMESSRIPTPKPKKHVNLLILHKVVCALFKKKFDRVVFHNDILANYKYYVKCLFLLDESSYRRAFELKALKKVGLVEPVSARINTANFSTTLMPKKSQEQIGLESAETKIEKIQDYRKILKDSKNPELQRKVKRLITCANRIINEKDIAEILKQKVVETDKQYLEDKYLNEKLKISIKEILSQVIPQTIVEYARLQGVHIFDFNSKEHFAPEIRTHLRKKTIDVTKKFPKDTAKIYFENLHAEPMYQLDKYRGLVSFKLSCNNQWESIFKEMLLKIKPVYHGMLIIHMISFDSKEEPSYVFWNNYFAILTLPNGLEICNNLSLYELYTIEGFQSVNWNRFRSHVLMYTVGRLKINQRLEVLAIEIINIACARFMPLTDLIIEKIPAESLGIFSDAICDYYGNFSANVFLRYAKLFMSFHNNSSVDFRFCDLISIVELFAKYEGNVELRTVQKRHKKASSFEDQLKHRGIATSISMAASSFYPTSNALGGLKTQEDGLMCYVNAILFSYLHSESPGELGFVSRVAHNFLRKADYNSNFLAVVSQLSSAYSSRNEIDIQFALYSILSNALRLILHFTVANQNKVQLYKHKAVFSLPYARFKTETKRLLGEGGPEPDTKRGFLSAIFGRG